MKAVIMAGGKGTRLRPLTSQMPKPMVPLLDRPCMEYIIDLLKRHGITEIAVTVQYLPQVIRNHFGDGSAYGVELHYFDEITPLGTAGSVKNAADFLDETFLVISGDALTDFDLSSAIRYHQQKNAIGTLVLTQVEVPLEYGVVMTQEDGKIVRFLEKPSWSEVFSDTVNTGIYVLEPEILNFFAAGVEYDFSKDLFPLVMQRDLPLYGYVAGGYWSDIGNLTQYRQTQFDMLNGLVDVQIKGVQIEPGVWVSEGVTLHEGVRLNAPVYLGEGTLLQPGAKVGPMAVLGRHNRVESGSEVERTVLWNRNYLGRASSLSGATLCNSIVVAEGAVVCEDAVIGDKSWLGELAVIKPGVKIWPDKRIGAHTIQQHSLIWADTSVKSLFGVEGISGVPNVEMTPEFIGRVAAAYTSTLRKGASVCISCDEYSYSLILKYALISGLLGGGAKVRDIGTALVPLARHEIRRSGSDGGLHIRLQITDGHEQVVLQFFDGAGLPIDKPMERKIENALLQEDFARPDAAEAGRLEQMRHDADWYVGDILSRIDVDAMRERAFAVALGGESRAAIDVMKRLLDELGCEVIALAPGEMSLETAVLNNRADLGLYLDSCGQTFQLYTGFGRELTPEQMLILTTMVALKGGDPVAIPVTAPDEAAELTAEMGVQVVRTKTGSRALLETGSDRPVQMHNDAFYTVVSVLRYLLSTGKSLDTVVTRLPQVHMSTDEVVCKVEHKGLVMRRLMEEMRESGQRLELIDGIKVLMEDGWALILPDQERALFKIVAQGRSRRKADELALMYKRKITMYQQG